MYKKLQQDSENLPKIIELFCEYAVSYLDSLDKRAVGIKQQESELQSLPVDGVGFFDGFEEFLERYENRLSASSGSRYFGFVTGGVTPAALIGDWLTSLYDNNVANLKESASNELTLETLSMLKELLELGDDFEGVFLSGATMSNFVALATAREWIGNYYGINISKEGVYKLPNEIKIYSASAHSSVYKALSMLGLGRNSLVRVKSLPNSEEIDLQELEKHLKNHKENPCIVVANFATVNCTSFDDLMMIVKLKDRYNFWLHVDAAFGGFARCSERFSHLARGLELADSITVDAHKWLNVPYDCGVVFTRHLDLQFEVFSNEAAYLRPQFSNDNFLHLTPENSQRMRALSVWFALKAYGKEGIKEIVQRDCDLAKKLSIKIQNSEKFTLLCDTKLNGVLFSIKNPTKEKIERFVDEVTKDGRIFISPTLFEGIPSLRVSITNWRSSSKDIEIAWAVLEEIYDKIK